MAKEDVSPEDPVSSILECTALTPADSSVWALEGEATWTPRLLSCSWPGWCLRLPGTYCPTSDTRFCPPHVPWSSPSSEHLFLAGGDPNIPDISACTLDPPMRSPTSPPLESALHVSSSCLQVAYLLHPTFGRRTSQVYLLVNHHCQDAQQCLKGTLIHEMAHRQCSTRLATIYNGKKC